MARAGSRLDAFSAWLAAFGDAWESADSERMSGLFAVGATLQPIPFADLLHGRRQIRGYFTELFAGRRAIRFQAQVLGVGDTYGVAHWLVSSVPAIGGAGPTATTLRDGILLCALDARGRCSSLRQWWHESEEVSPG